MKDPKSGYLKYGNDPAKHQYFSAKDGILFSMKANIHPKTHQATVTCACGNTFTTESTLESIHVEICSACHPFFTGKQKFIDTAGRVERFKERLTKVKLDKLTTQTPVVATAETTETPAEA